MDPKKQKTGIEVVHISENERKSMQISDHTLQNGLQEFHRNGIVILENAIRIHALNHIRERMLQDIPRNLASPRVHYNHGRELGNISQTPPLLPEYLHEEIWANPFAVTLIEHIIGPCPQLSYATSNIALPGGHGRQAVHSDYYSSHLDFPVFLEACIFLDSVSSHNGSTEIWPGTHVGYNQTHRTFADLGWIHQSTFSARAQISPPVQPSIAQGSICIRDLRLWHAGMANGSDAPRIMLGLLYSPVWFGSHMRLRFPAAARDRVAAWEERVDCLSVAEFVEGEFDYLEFRQDLNLTQEKARAGEAEAYVSRHGSIVAGPGDYWTPTDR